MADIDTNDGYGVSRAERYGRQELRKKELVVNGASAHIRGPFSRHPVTMALAEQIVESIPELEVTSGRGVKVYRMPRPTQPEPEPGLDPVDLGYFGDEISFDKLGEMTGRARRTVKKWYRRWGDIGLETYVGYYDQVVGCPRKDGTRATMKRERPEGYVVTRHLIRAMKRAGIHAVASKPEPE